MRILKDINFYCGRLLVKDGVGGTAKTVLEQAAEDSAASAARKLAETTVTESTETTVGNLFKSFKEAPGKSVLQVHVSYPPHPFRTSLFLLDFPLYTWVLVI
jgi:hypothetical protein